MGIAELRSTHVHPVRTLRGHSPRQAVVEPWRPTGDRRRALIDDGGRVVTRRAQPRPAPAAAEPLSGGGIRLPAPGQAPPEVAAPEPVAAVPAGVHGTQVHGTQEEGVLPARPRTHGATTSWEPTSAVSAWVRDDHVVRCAEGEPDLLFAPATRSTRPTRCRARPCASPPAALCRSPHRLRPTPATPSRRGTITPPWTRSRSTSPELAPTSTRVISAPAGTQGSGPVVGVVRSS
ncbi:MOSC N-terminal beta barrel domain-containing protein [Streptomyces sp. NPDC056660]|uniref:MOSC N-terminal beta barrel domain-containing protein n=1 Tax=Streptomyces sp. NPDC056660 TaxID=3345897 RepID=UPI00369A73A4